MSGLIPQAFITDILSRIDIVELIDTYVPLKKTGTSYVACCPFHQEKSPSFNVISKKQFYHCFGCGVSGNAISFLMSYLHLGFVEAVEELANRLGLEVPKDQATLEKRQQSTSLYKLLDQVSQHYQNALQSPRGRVALKYLYDRGFDEQTIKRFQLGYAYQGWENLESQFKAHREGLIQSGMLVEGDRGRPFDRYRHRIMFPILDRQGHMVGFGGRAVDATQKPKYLNSPENSIFQKGRELYGLYYLSQTGATFKNIIIVEGYFDVIALAQHGVSNAVAALGTATNPYHIQTLSKYTKQLIFCFDGDVAGRQAAWRALESCLGHLQDGLDVRFVFLPEGHDPDSFIREGGVEAFNQKLLEAVPFNIFFIDTLTKELDILSAAGKSQLINEAQPYLMKMQESPSKQLLLDDLARLSRIESHRLNQLIQEKPPETKEQPEKKPKNQSVERSPIRLAIAILIQNPEIFKICQSKVNTDLLDSEGQKILKKLIEQIAKNTEITTAMLIEQWRGTSFFSALNKLAAWDHQVPKQALAREFVDIILFLQKQNLEYKISEYLAKARHKGLTFSEQQVLQEMLKKKHQQVDDKK